MATVTYGVSFQTQQAQQQLAALHNRGTQLFNRPFNVKVDSKGLVGFNRSLDQATSRILAFTATTTLLYQTGNALKNLTTQAIQVETAIAGIQAILGATNADLQKVTSSLFTIANKTGVSFYDAAAAAEEFSRAGLSLEKTLQATAAALGIVRTSGGKIQEVIQGLISTTSAFADQNFGFQEVADKLSALDAAFSTSASGIIQAFSRVGSFASEAGVSLDQLGGLIATVKQISGRSEAQIGNSIKSIFVNLQNENVQNIIEGVGVATKDANGEFRSAIDVLTDLSGAYKNLTDSQRAFLTQKVAGKFQANAFQSAVQGIQTGVFSRAVGISSGADNDIAKRLETLNATTAITIQKFQNSITELASTLGDAVGRNFVEGLLRYGNNAVDVLKKVFERGNPVGEGISAGLTAALTGPGIVLGVTLLAGLFKKVSAELLVAGRTLLQQVGLLGGQNSALKQRITLEQRVNELLKQRTHFTGANGTQIPINPTGPLSRPVRPNFTAIAQQANAQANFGQTPAVTLASARNQYRADLAAYRKQQNENRRAARRNQILAREQFTQEERARRRSQFGTRAAGAGIFLVPAITSGIASQLPEGSQRRQVDAIGQGLSTALTGAFFGPIGAAAGILVGGFQILSTSVRELYGNIDDVNRVATENINQNNKQQQSGDLYIQSLQAYNDALKTGKSNLINRAKTDLLTAGRDLTGNRRGLIGNRSLEDLIEQNDAFGSDTQRRNNAETARGIVEKLVTESYSGFKGFEGLFGKQSAGNVDSSGLVKALVDSLNLDKIDGSKVGDLLSNFGRSGNSSPIEQFTNSLFKGSQAARESLAKFAEQYETGAQTLSVKIAQEIEARQKYAKILEIEAQRLQEQAGLNKIFTTEVSNAFIGANFRDKINKLNRGSAAASFQSQTAGLGGIAGIKAEIQGELLNANQGYVDEIDSAKAAFRKDLEGAINDGVTGQADRGKLLAVLEEKFGEGFNPNDIQKILTDIIGKSKSDQIFLALKTPLKEFNESVKLSSAALDISTKQIQEAGARMLRTAQKGFGDPRKDQSAEINALINGQGTLRRGYGARPGDRNLTKQQIAARDVQTAREILDVYENQGKLGIFTGAQSTRKNDVRAAYNKLYNAQRIQTSQGIFGEALNNLGKNFSFGSGSYSKSGFQKFVNEQIEKGDFTNFDRSPVTGALKDAASSGNQRAQDVLNALEDARKSFESMDEASKAASDIFLNENQLLTKIQVASERTATAAEQTARNTAISTTAPGISGPSTQQVADAFQKEAQIANLVRKQQDLQGILNSVQEKDRVGSAAFLEFNQNRSSFLGTRTISSMLAGTAAPTAQQKQFLSNLSGQNRTDAINSPEFRGKSITQDESKVIDVIARKIATEGFNREGLETLLKNIFGNVRGDEIFKGGAFDPLRPIQKINYNENELKTVQNQLRDNVDKQNTLRAELALEKNVQVLTDIAAAITQGINVVFSSQIGVDVKGAPTTEFKTNLEQTIRTAVTDLMKEANGKAPVIAPKAP